MRVFLRFAQNFVKLRRPNRLSYDAVILRVDFWLSNIARKNSRAILKQELRSCGHLLLLYYALYNRLPANEIFQVFIFGIPPHQTIILNHKNKHRKKCQVCVARDLPIMSGSLKCNDSK